MNTNELFLKPDEGKFLGLAVIECLTHLKEGLQNTKLPWSPESRKTMKEMVEAGERLRIKLEKLGFDVRPLPDLEDGEEQDYLTKQS